VVLLGRKCQLCWRRLVRLIHNHKVRSFVSILVFYEEIRFLFALLGFLFTIKAISNDIAVLG
jgi:hypothetical protein